MIATICLVLGSMLSILNLQPPMLMINLNTIFSIFQLRELRPREVK